LSINGRAQLRENVREARSAGNHLQRSLCSGQKRFRPPVSRSVLFLFRFSSYRM